MGRIAELRSLNEVARVIARVANHCFLMGWCRHVDLETCLPTESDRRSSYPVEDRNKHLKTIDCGKNPCGLQGWWARPDLNWRPSQCQCDVITPRPRAQYSSVTTGHYYTLWVLYKGWLAQGIPITRVYYDLGCQRSDDNARYRGNGPYFGGRRGRFGEKGPLQRDRHV